MTDKLKHLAEYLNIIGNGADARLVHDAALQIEMLKREIRIGKEINDALQERLNNVQINRDVTFIHHIESKRCTSD